MKFTEVVDTMTNILVIQSYAPQCSRFNPVERTWSYLTKCLVGVRLDDQIDGQTPADKDHQAWNQVLDQAVIDCGRYWDGKRFGGFPISVTPLYSSDPTISSLKSMHVQLQEFVGASKKMLSKLPQLKSDYQFFVKHLNRKSYQMEFIRCDDDKCQHCQSLPARDNHLLDLLRSLGAHFRGL